MPIDAGAYDPRKASIYYQQDRSDPTYGNEPVKVATLFIETHIRFPRQERFAIEREVSKQNQSFGQSVIVMRRNSKTRRIQPDMEIHHDGRIFGVIGLQTLPSSERDEIGFLVQFRDRSQIFTP
jgi:hypothetical protein